MDGSGNPRPRKIWVRPACSEEIAVEEHGYIFPWNDDPRSTYKLIALLLLSLTQTPPPGGYRPETLRAYSPGCYSHHEGREWNPTGPPCCGVFGCVMDAVDPNVAGGVRIQRLTICAPKSRQHSSTTAGSG